ncbi:MAG: hypothetical protein AAB402_04630 [Patescibacteria group bacterium]
MFTRKQQQRLRRVLTVAVVALVINVIVPVKVQAQTVSPSDTTENSNAVIVQPSPTDKPSIPRTTLPSVTDKRMVKTIVVRASAYSSTVDQTDGDPFTTASGTKVRDGGIAMNGIAFGTKVRIPSHYGDEVFTVIDRMNVKWGTKRIDIWMPSRSAAKQWGVRTVILEILS